MATVAAAGVGIRASSDSDIRSAGFAGLAFAGLLVVQNVVRSAGSPPNDAPAADILRYVTSSRTALEVLLALFVPGFLALFWFVSGLIGRARAGGVDGPWATFGLVGVVLVGAMFAVSNAIEASLVALAPRLADSPAIVETLWAVHAATFTLNMVAIATALLGLSRVGIAAGVTPRALNPIALLGVALLFAGAVPVVAVVAGSAWFYVPFPGFLLWIVWVAVTGYRMTQPLPPRLD